MFLSFLIQAHPHVCMMLATSLSAGRSVARHIYLPCSSFHSALKRQLKADKKTKEKEAKLAAEAAVEVRVHAVSSGGVAYYTGNYHRRNRQQVRSMKNRLIPT